ncbi:MAG: FAD-dependent oxidoreductase [Rhizobiaceae bacterium]|nr:FAD-dependent oxidoreductase [Rhizobiaceae bacterium]
MNAGELADTVPVIVGAGPAGLAAAGTLVRAGLRPVVLDEAERPGGQGTRRLTPLIADRSPRLFGSNGASKIAQREAVEDDVLLRCDYRPGSMVWGVFGGKVELLQDGHVSSMAHGPLLLATGAIDRILPLPGWTLPGVYALGGAQVALKRHGCLIGQRTVFAGSSPLLYLAAAQYLRMGAKDIVVLDTTPLNEKIRAAPGMARYSLSTLLRGLSLMAELRRAGVRMLTGVRLDRIVGDERVEAIQFRSRRGPETINCDSVALGHGLRPETQLAELAGAKLEYDPVLRHWFPQADAEGRAGPLLWVAGDSARTAGADGAAVAGKLAALSILKCIGKAPAGVDGQISRLQRRLHGWRAFQRAMSGAFKAHGEGITDLPDDTLLCRCERISLGDVRDVVARLAGPMEVNRLKAVTRCGMGRCQGRYCATALAETLSGLAGKSMKDCGYLHAQAPVRPVPIGTPGEEGA